MAVVMDEGVMMMLAVEPALVVVVVGQDAAGADGDKESGHHGRQEICGFVFHFPSKPRFAHRCHGVKAPSRENPVWLRLDGAFYCYPIIAGLISAHAVGTLANMAGLYHVLRAVFDDRHHHLLCHAGDAKRSLALDRFGAPPNVRDNVSALATGAFRPTDIRHATKVLGVGPIGFEPMASWSVARRSNPLS